MEDPREDHYTVMKKLLHYMAETINYGIIYPRWKEAKLELTGYNDMARDIDGRKSTTGVLFFLSRCPIF